MPTLAQLQVNHPVRLPQHPELLQPVLRQYPQFNKY
jgi:hypothetical protein